MNTSITSESEILRVCRELVASDGIAAIQMRTVAKKCNVALGALYYYFPSKHALLLAVITSVWDDMFAMQTCVDTNKSFVDYVECCFAHLKAGMQKYPNFFTIHSLSFSSSNKKQAHAFMQRYLHDIKGKLSTALAHDKGVRKDSFNNNFSASHLIDFILVNMLCLLVQGEADCQTLLEVIRRSIY